MLSKTKKIIIFFVAAIILSSAIFFYELVFKRREEIARDEQKALIEFQSGDVNYIVIENLVLKNNVLERIVLQKNQDGWYLIEPLQDKADQVNMSSLLEVITAQKSKKLNIDNTNLSEYKMDKPETTWIIKTAKGASVKVLVSQENNFEGFPFIKTADSDTINLGSGFWRTTAQQNLTYYREKRLMRKELDKIDQVKVRSLSNEFALQKRGELWAVAGQNDFALDQKKVRNFLVQLAALEVAEYLSEGEPSLSELKEKGLDKNYVQIQIPSSNGDWSVRFQMDEKTSSLYGLTDRPTQLIKLDVLKWELLANLNLDQFRDRASSFSFNSNEVQKIFVKTQEGEFELQKSGQWKVARSTMPQILVDTAAPSTAMDNYLQDFSNQELTYFLEKSEYSRLTGNNMIIMKSENDQLLIQLNWGPQMKKKIFGLDREFYLARTHQDPMVFGLAVDAVNKLTDFKFLKKE